MVDLVHLSAEVCELGPADFAKVLRAHHGNRVLCDNAFYTAILCYLDQSLACNDMDKAGKLGVYKQLAEALFFPCDMTGDYLSLVVSTFPYLLKSGMHAKVVAAAAEGLAEDKQYRFLVEENEHLRLRVADMSYRLSLAHHHFRRDEEHTKNNAKRPPTTSSTSSSSVIAV